ncbi:MAG: Uma2 family endonuclease [Chloroflexi bacterium]|nr:Uma2 family endonuclease [Chloroflexota bacterium]
MVQPTRTGIKASEYYQLAEYQQHELIQLINGEVIIGMPPVLKHQDIVREILILLALIARRLGGKAYASPIEVHLDDNNVFEPDVLYIQSDNLTITQLDEKRIMGAPDLVVEVLSPGTAKFDRQEKYQAYEKHGVHEYWIVDPVHEVVEVWNLSADGRYTRQGAFAGEDSFESAVLDESISVKAIFNV